MSTGSIKTVLLGSPSSNTLNSYPVLKMIKLIFTYLSIIVLGLGLIASILSLFQSFYLFIGALVGTFIAWGLLNFKLSSSN